MKYTLCVVLASIWIFSFAAQAVQEEEFIEALVSRNYEEATRIYDEHQIDPNREILPSHPGRTPFIFAVACRQTALALRMLELGAQVTTMIHQGPDRGITPLYLAAFRWEWQVVAYVLLNRLEANLEVAPLQQPHNTLAGLLNAPEAPKWVSTLFFFARYLDPERGNKCSTLCNMRLVPFYNAVTAFVDPQNPTTTLSVLPPEMRWQLADDAVFAQYSELKEVPRDLKERVAKLIRRILEDVQTFEASLNLAPQSHAQILRHTTATIVAAKVLQHLYPIESRKRSQKTIVIKIREWIVALVSRHLVDRILEKEDRDRLIALLIEVPTNKITRKWINEQIFLFFHPQTVPVALVEEPHEETKRARENEEHDVGKLKIRVRRPRIEPAHDNNLREGLIRDVIRDAPGLDMDQVTARVDEIMADGVQRMDLEGNATEVDPSELLRAAFHPAVMQRSCS